MKKQKTTTQKPKLTYRVNEQIRVPEVRIVFQDGTQQVMKTIESAQESEARIESLSKAVQRIDSSFIQGFRKTGFARYDAVPGQGGMQSFSIALLDDANSGLILTVITGRAESRTYCKPVVNGISNMMLSDEEKLVIASATLPAQQGLASSSA